MLIETQRMNVAYEPQSWMNEVKVEIVCDWHIDFIDSMNSAEIMWDCLTGWRKNAFRIILWIHSTEFRWDFWHQETSIFNIISPNRWIFQFFFCDCVMCFWWRDSIWFSLFFFWSSMPSSLISPKKSHMRFHFSEK